MIKVFIVDDHKMVIEGLQLLLENEPEIMVVGSAMSGLEAIDNIPARDIDVVLLDINMPDLNGIETCKRLLRINSELKIIAISMHKESSLIKMILNNGAKGYVLKNAGKEEVVKAINAVNDGEHYIEDAVNKIVIGNLMGKKKTQSPFPTISNREKDVLECILDEYTTAEIADKLHISFGTVETHRRNMLIKTGARNTAGLVRIALEYGLSKRENLNQTA